MSALVGARAICIRITRARRVLQRRRRRRQVGRSASCMKAAGFREASTREIRRLNSRRRRRRRGQTHLTGRNRFFFSAPAPIFGRDKWLEAAAARRSTQKRIIGVTGRRNIHHWRWLTQLARRRLRSSGSRSFGRGVPLAGDEWLKRVGGSQVRQILETFAYAHSRDDVGRTEMFSWRAEKFDRLAGLNSIALNRMESNSLCFASGLVLF